MYINRGHTKNQGSRRFNRWFGRPELVQNKAIYTVGSRLTVEPAVEPVQLLVQAKKYNTSVPPIS